MERVALHCPECGFVNTDGANYCQKCGAFLAAEQHDGDVRPRSRTRSTRRPVSSGPVDLDDVVAPRARRWSSAPAAAASGRAFPLDGERMTIGRRPESDVFLDDVTVSRDHAMLVRRGDGALPRRPRLAQRHVRQPPAHRVAQRLEDGDELQIGKYKLTYLAR